MKQGREQGSVFVEFVIIILPLLIFILGIVQIAFLTVGRMTVERAANAAVRSAVVVLDDDPRHYGGAPRNSIAGGGGGEDPLALLLDWRGLSSPATGTGGGRLGAIRAAAAKPLMALPAPVVPGIGIYSLRDGLSGREQAAALYSRAALAVSFPSGPGSSGLRSRIGPDDTVTVRVTYVYHCNIPLARLVVCGGADDITTSGNLAAEFSVSSQSSLSHLDALSGARFRTLQAEATLPNQGARYQYGGPL